MRITICGYDGHGYFGGPIEWYKRLGPALRDIGVEVDFLFITDHAPKLCGTYLQLKREGFHCRALRRHSLTQLRDNTEGRVRWILRQLRRRPPDLFVANLSVSACFAGRWVQEAGIPAVCVLHSADTFYEGMAERFLHEPGPFRLQVGVCVSEALEALTRERVSSDRSKIVRIPCGTPVPAQVAAWNKQTLRIVYVGRLVEKAKRASEVARAFCRVTREVDNTEAVIIGDGSAKAAVERIVANAGNARVSCLGRIDSSRIQDELLKCQVFVLLSDFEGLPIALMEAMACGVVPVCLDIRSGIPELVKHEETGLLVKDRGDNFVRAIRQLREQPDLWWRLSRAARAKVKREYSTQFVAGRWKRMAERLQAEAGDTHPIKIPGRLDLRPLHTRLAGDDRRWPGWGRYLAHQIRRFKRHIPVGGREALGRTPS